MSTAETVPLVRSGPWISAREWRMLLVSVLILLIAACVPLVVGGYVLQVGISIVMYAAFATSWLLFLARPTTSRCARLHSSASACM